MTKREVEERLSKLALSKHSLVLTVRDIRKAVIAGEISLPTGDVELRALRKSLGDACTALAAIEAELEATKIQQQAIEAQERRPELELLIDELTALGGEADECAAKIQACLLDTLAPLFCKLDDIRGQMFDRVKDRSGAGAGGNLFHPLAELQSGPRLLPALSAMLEGTSYQRCVKRPLLRPRHEDFGAAEAEVTQKILAQLQARLAELDSLAALLSKEKVA
jgi:hypothetical protein